jgi:mannosyltransferase
MTTARRISLDCIIFGLQRFGGISNYWARVIDHACDEPTLEGTLVLPQQLTFSNYDAGWTRRMAVLHDALDARIARYLHSPVAAAQDVFHTSYYRLPRRRAGKYVVSAYDFTYERYRSGLARRVHSLQKFTSLERADAVLCISESTRRDVLEFCPRVDARKLHVVPLGIDRAAFYPEPTVQPPARKNTVLFVGQRAGYKRFDLAIAAIQLSKRLSLGIVGPELTTEEREALHGALGERWHEFGPVSSARLRQLYSSANAFVFPSDYEGFGLPVLEAMACGCPVVAANKASLPEVGGSAALYAESQSGEAYAAALQALESADSRESTVRAGIARAEQFSWSQTMRETFAIYQQ